MALSNIRSVPRTPEDLSNWAFVHAAFHRDTIRLIYQNYQKVLAEYVLSDFDPENMNNWLFLHQSMHDDMNSVLNIDGFNFDELDWKDERAVLDWFGRHAAEHEQAGQILGIS